MLEYHYSSSDIFCVILMSTAGGGSGHPPPPTPPANDEVIIPGVPNPGDHIVDKERQQRYVIPEDTTTGLQGTSLTINRNFLDEGLTYAVEVEVDSYGKERLLKQNCAYKFMLESKCVN